MNTNESPTRRRIREAAKELNLKTGRESLASNVQRIRNKVLSSWNALIPPAGAGALGLESIQAGAPKRNEDFNVATHADPAELMRELSQMKMSPRHIEQVAEQIFDLFDGTRYNAAAILTDDYQITGRGASLADVVGRTSAAMIANSQSEIGVEAFGDDINRLNTDDRLTMDLTIMRPYDNILDKALARVTDSSPVVTIRVPSPEVWDWAKTQDANATAAQRNSGTIRLRDLYRNPTPVNSAPKKIVPLSANDSGSVLWNSTTNFKTALDVNVIDLSKTSATWGFQQADRTDLVADGGQIDSVIISIKSGSTTEYFKLATTAFAEATYVISPNNKSSGQRQVVMEVVLPIYSTTLQYNGTASTIAAQLNDAVIRANIRINSTLNIQNGNLQASGSVNLQLLPLAGGGAISGATNTLFAGLTTALVAYSTDLYFDEENQRKANLSVWVQYYEQQFVVPRSRIYFTEYALTQDIDENAVASTSSVMALGNGRRGLAIIVNALNDVASALDYSKTHPEIVSVNKIDEQSFASSLVKPTVVTTVLDYDNEEINTMNESTRLSEMHGRFRARFLSLATVLFAKSLMLNQYKGGETPVIKAFVHSTIADIVIGILDYHPELKDAESVATGADYSMTLPNGYRLDVVKTNLDCLQGRLYAIPVIESQMDSILSAASIRDCGTVTTNYTPTYAGAVIRRVATTTREIVMMSNKVGICMDIRGIQQQLGTAAYTPVTLSADFSDSVTI